MGLSEEARLLWRGQMSFRLLLHAVLLYTILMHIIKIRSDLLRITVYLEPLKFWRIDALCACITVNWDPTVWSYKGEFKHTDYSDKWTAYSGVTSPARRVQGGLGYYAYLDSSGKNLVGDTRFTLIPAKTPLYPEGSSKPHFTSEINVNYGHDKNPLTWVTGVSFSVEGVGVGLTLGDLTDEASDTYTGYYSWSK